MRPTERPWSRHYHRAAFLLVAALAVTITLNPGSDRAGSATLLIAQGRMKRAGLAAFNARDAQKTGRYSYERDNPTFDAASLRALKADRKAYAYFEALPPGVKRVVTHWITSARREDTRTRRLAHLIERSRAGKRIDLLRPVSRD